MLLQAKTAAVLLGASSFNSYPAFKSSEAFLCSHHDFLRYLRDPSAGLALEDSAILDLYDSSLTPSAQLVSIGEFLSTFQGKSNVGRNVIVFYVGHGYFSGPNQDYSLALACTDERYDGVTGLRIIELAQVVKASAAQCRRFIILDCCFAAEATKWFQGATESAIARKVAGAFGTNRPPVTKKDPAKGTALLCASGPDDFALSPPGLRRTMFSDALLTVLTVGDSRFPERLTLADIQALTEERIFDTHDRPVRPELHNPDQSDGNISANVLLFPNPSPNRAVDTVAIKENPRRVPSRPGHGRRPFYVGTQANRYLLLAVAVVMMHLCWYAELYAESKGLQAWGFFRVLGASAMSVWSIAVGALAATVIFLSRRYFGRRARGVIVLCLGTIVPVPYIYRYWVGHSYARVGLMWEGYEISAQDWAFWLWRIAAMTILCAAGAIFLSGTLTVLRNFAVRSRGLEAGKLNVGSVIRRIVAPLLAFSAAAVIHYRADAVDHWIIEANSIAERTFGERSTPTASTLGGAAAGGSNHSVEDMAFEPAPKGYYRVKPGDTVYRIALENGLNYRDFMNWNNVTEPSQIKVGQLLRTAPPGSNGPAEQ